MSDEPFHPHGHVHASPPGPAGLRSRGRRLTRQRELIWAALTAAPDTHLSAADVAAHVRAELPRVNPSTVYRTLELLVEERLVLRTDLGAERVFYEPAHDHRHHHVVCRSCGNVAHVHDDALGDLRAHVQRASGYALGDEEVTLFGLCPACQTSSEPTPRRSQTGRAEIPPGGTRALAGAGSSGRGAELAPTRHHARYRASKATQGARMSEHEHDHPHTHEHSHGDVTHSHPHAAHEHEHVEHGHEHSHGDVTHSHPHVHEAGNEHEHEHEHEALSA